MSDEATNGKRPRWEPGTLPTAELEQLLMDTLADLWADAYRRDDSTGGTQFGIFRRRVELALYCATGQEVWLTRNFGERG